MEESVIQHYKLIKNLLAWGDSAEFSCCGERHKVKALRFPASIRVGESIINQFVLMTVKSLFEICVNVGIFE